MGTWGTDILDNDTSSDVYADYISLCTNLSTEEVMEKITQFYGGKLQYPEDRNNVWLAIAYAQLETNTLQKEVAERVRNIIELGLDLELWKELKSSEQDLKARKEALERLLTRIEQYNLHV